MWRIYRRSIRKLYKRNVEVGIDDWLLKELFEYD